MADHSSISDYLKQKIYTISHPGMSHEEMLDGYENWCKQYDKDLAQGDYSGPYNTAVTVNRYYKPDERKHVRILDVGAGTGLVAEELRKLGFEKMDALDPQRCMLDVAREKGVYHNYIEEYLSPNEHSSIQKDTYDCVTASSAFGPFHIPCECLNELIRIVRPGGIIVISTRKSSNPDYFTHFSKCVGGLISAGAIESVDQPTHSVYLTGSEGISYVFRVL